MSVGYCLVNQTKHECVLFSHIPASTARELAGSPVAAAITAWYLLHHRGDAVAFVSDTHGDWPFASGTRADMRLYPDVTDAVVSELVAAGILADDGREVLDEAEPEVYVRRLRNVWMES